MAANTDWFQSLRLAAKRGLAGLLRPRVLLPLPVAGVVLALGLFISFSLWRSAESDQRREARARLDASAGLALAAIGRRLEEYQVHLHGMQGLFVADDDFNRSKFRRYCESFYGQMRLPGIKAVHFTRYVPGRDKDAFVASVRQDRTLDKAGFPDFSIHPPGDRPEYFVIDFIEPLARNLRAFGLDAASQAVNRQAFLAARDANRPTMTAPFQLVQAAAGERGLVMRAAVYRYRQPQNTVAERRAAFVGLVGISLDAADMFRDVFAEPYLNGLHIGINDILPESGSAPHSALRQLIADNRLSRSTDADAAADLTTVALIAAGQRQWEIRISGSAAWAGGQTGSHAPLTILITGAVISMLLSLLYLSLARSKTRAEQLALQMTHDLRQSEQQSRKTASVLQATLDNMSQGISVVDEQLQMTALNSRFCEILDFPPEMAHETASFESFIRHNARRGEYGPCDVEAKVCEMVALARSPQPHRFKRTRANGMSVEVVGEPLPGGGFVTTYTDITEQEQAAQALRRSEQRYRALVEMLPEAVFMLRHGCIVFANQSALSLLAAPSAQAVLGHDIRQIIHPDHREQEVQRLELLQSTGQDSASVPWSELQYLRWDGRAVPVEAVATRVELDDGPVVLAVIRDITERKLTEQRLQLAASVFTHAREGIMITDAGGLIVEVNATFTQITGYARDEVLGREPGFLRSERQSPEYDALMRHDLQTQGHWSGELWDRRKNGEIYPCMLTISAVGHGSDPASHYVTLFSDITALKEHQQQLEHMAHNDTLTGLPNRVLLADRLRQAITLSQRSKRSLAVVYLDLDGFKDINDRHGHDVGDQLLIALSQHMKSALREGDTLARLGGDEFVAVLVDLEQVQDYETVLTRLLQAAAMQIPVKALLLQVSASIGVTVFPQDPADADQLLRHADQAMYQAKQAGRNRYHLFDVVQDTAMTTRHESLEHIRQAIVQQQFRLYYQPKVNMKTGVVVGAEALIRWQHPERGLLAPAAFLPIIEDHPVSVTLGDWVIETALAQMAAWQAQGIELHVSVNVGARQLQQGDFVSRLSSQLARHATVPGGWLELEVLETSALEDIQKVSDIMRACQGLGVRFALDDFGTGYSSLTYLKRLPAEVVKIDQSFVRDMLDDPDDLAIVQSVLGLATTFHRTVIAEGVETLAHGEALLAFGYELAQGYGIARPMPAENLPAWLAGWRPDNAWLNWRDRPHQHGLVALVFAEVEHRHWLRELEALLADQRDGALPLNTSGCRFDGWLESEGRARFSAHPAFACACQAHEQSHSLGTELLRRHGLGEHEQVQSGLTELHALQAEWSASVRQMMRIG
jgi:diguanylate cyclase (GGDEF)-like protein/PAS domain S-box-containing protein